MRMDSSCSHEDETKETLPNISLCNVQCKAKNLTWDTSSLKVNLIVCAWPSRDKL